MKTMLLKLLLILFTCSFLFLGCPVEKPCTTCPQPSTGDTLITFERELADGEQPAVSPDGSKIAFTHKGDIFVMDTSVQTTVTWDGNKFIYDTTGGTITQLTSGPEIDIQPRWHPNGQTIGFIRKNEREENKGFIFSVKVTGGNTAQIIFNQFVEYNLNYHAWDWSPDGKYIAILSYDNINNKEYLNIIRSTDNQLIYSTQLYEYLAHGSNNSSFAWSLTPDEIAYTSQFTDPEKSGDVWLVNFITTKVLKDTFYFQYPSSLFRSPFTNKFAYHAVDLTTSQIIVTDFTNKIAEYVVSSAGGLKWSYDERYFLYYKPEHVYDGPFSYNYSRIAIFSIKDNKEYLLTKSGDVNQFNPFFECGHATNEVYFERYKKINKVTFQLPQ